MCGQIILRPDVPRDPDKFREWLKEWHQENNRDAVDNDRVAGFVVSEKGRELLALSSAKGVN